jgi:CHAD domain-containing protein
MANEPAMCAGDAEALHQMRIGIRRVRAALAVFADVVGDEDLAKIKKELRWMMRELGPARDLDVFGADVLHPLRADRPGDEVIAASHRDFQQRRMAAYARAAAAARSGRFRQAVLHIAEWIEAGPWTVDGDKQRKALRAVAEHARKKLAPLRKRIKKKGAPLKHRSVGQRHRLRIRAKRLRYATEFFAATFPGEAAAKRRTESLAALKDLQDALGGLNDLATHRGLIVGGLGGDGNAIGPAAAAGLTDAKARTKNLLVKAEQALARFAGTKPFWTA